MKNLIKLFAIAITCTSSLTSIAAQPEIVTMKIPPTSRNHNFQDTIFIKNYLRGNKVAYVYANPNATSKTKIKIPKNVMITTITRSGNFEYGSFDVSSTKTYKGWFLISDLQEIRFTPPKID